VEMIEHELKPGEWSDAEAVASRVPPLRPDYTGFVECDACRAKPGTPLLCAGCAYNRSVLSGLFDHRVRLAAVLGTCRDALWETLIAAAEKRIEVLEEACRRRYYVCERCGGTGTQEAGCYNHDTKRYDSPAGYCRSCAGCGYLGPQNKEAALNELLHKSPPVD